MAETPTSPQTEPVPEYYIHNFPAPGLRQVFRHITGNNPQGKSVFLSSDHGEHYRFMVENQAVANIIYSTRETPVDLKDNVDVRKAHEQEVRSIYDQRIPASHMRQLLRIPSSPLFIIQMGPSSA